VSRFLKFAFVGGEADIGPGGELLAQLVDAFLADIESEDVVGGGEGVDKAGADESNSDDSDEGSGELLDGGLHIFDTVRHVESSRMVVLSFDDGSVK
jgi:hypothetical protein